MTGLLCAFLALTGAINSSTTVSDREEELFKKNIGLYLTRDSWNDALAYLHGHFLMVPLHAAFLENEPNWQKQFEDQYRRLIQIPRSNLCKNPLSRLQYLYTATRFLALSARFDRKSDIMRPLTSYLTDEITDRWISQDAIGFDIPHFHGVKERVEHKLTLVNPAKSYYAAITDEEAFLFAEAADLLYVESKTKVKNPEHDTLRDIVQTGTRVYRERGEFTRDGGWLFDIGMWTDHPDLIFAGQQNIVPGMSEKKVGNITMDTSHFHRFALFVNSMRDANSPGSGDNKFFEKIRLGLAKQLVSKVLRAPTSDMPGYRLTNFMNGMNGVYRYNSADDIGRDKGYGPFELSGTFLIGWWSFLGDDNINKSYGEISKTFPLGEDVMKVYMGPVYKPAPRSDKTWYENGLAELFTSLGAKMRPLAP